MAKKMSRLTDKEIVKLKEKVEDLGHSVVLSLIKSTEGCEIPGTGRFALKDVASYLEIKEPTLRSAVTRIQDTLSAEHCGKIPSEVLVDTALKSGASVSYNELFTKVYYGTDEEDMIVTPNHPIFTVSEKVVVELIFLRVGKTPLSNKLVSALGGTKSTPKAKTEGSFSQRITNSEVEVEEEDRLNMYSALANTTTKLQEAEESIKEKDSQIALLVSKLGGDKSERMDMLETNSTLQLIVAFLLNPNYKDAQEKLLDEALAICKECGVSVGGN